MSTNTNLGPLTTTYTPEAASKCLSSTFYGTNSKGDEFLELGPVGAATSSCYPSSFNRTASMYFSPGICPSGYSYACTTATTSNGDDMTIGTCCPTGYFCRESRGSNVFACVSSFASTTTMAMGSYSFGSASIATGTTTITIDAGASVNAYGLIVRRASTDPTWALTATTATATGTSSSFSSSISATATTSNNNTSSADSSAGLSTGAKAGIGVGVSVGCVLIAAACVVGYVFGKRASRHKADGGVPHHAEQSMRYYGDPAQEMLASQERHELNSPPEISELDSTQKRGGPV